MNPAKLALARTFDALGLNGALLGLQRAWLGPHLRIVNYHDVPPSRAAEFEAQVRYFADRFAPVGLSDLLALQRGEWKDRRPGLVLSFDDGLRSHTDVVAPILERYGFVGWFVVPVGFVEAPAAEQAAFARAHHIHAAAEYADTRLALSWDDVRRLDARHVVGCHTWNHTRLASTLAADELEREIPAAKRRLEEELGHAVGLFAWVGGEEWAYSAEAARAVRRAGFRVAFMTNNAPVRPGCDLLQLQRTNLEADFPPALVRFHLCGFLDVLYTPKRARVNRLTASGAESA